MLFDEPAWRAARLLWSLEPGVAFLDHGSYGAVPIAAQRAQQLAQEEMEANPARFFSRGLVDRIGHIARHLARFLTADPDGLHLVPSPAVGACTVLRSIGLRSGDEVLLTDHSQGAVRRAVDAVCRETGATVVISSIPLCAAADEIIETVLSRTGPRTRLVVIEHVTSVTARLFPVASLTARLAGKNIPTLVDGTQCLGMVPVDLRRLNAPFWVGGFDTWACAPRGTGLLYAAGDHRNLIRTPEAAWSGADRPGPAEATRWLAVPAALHVLGTLGWTELGERNAALAEHGREILATALDDGVAAPHDPGVSMRVVALPPGVATTTGAAAALREAVADRLRVEVAVHAWHGAGLLRLSAHAYNRPEDYERLAEGLPGLLRSLSPPSTGAPVGTAAGGFDQGSNRARRGTRTNGST